MASKILIFLITCKLFIRWWRLLFLILFAVLAWPLAYASSCPASVSSLSAITEEQFSFTGYSSTTTYAVERGAVSNSLYYSLEINSPKGTVIRRVNADGTQNWLVSFAFESIIKSLSIDSTEQNVYFWSRTNPIVVLRLSASNGAIVSQNQL